MDIWYTALFVIDQKKLLELFPPKHEVVFAHHSTLAFETGNLDGIDVGKHWNVKVLGRATDKQGDALLVENPKSKNKYPHITISCVKGGDPIYSNELLERAVKNGTISYLEKPVVIEMIEGYGDHSNKVYLKI